MRAETLQCLAVLSSPIKLAGGGTVLKMSIVHKRWWGGWNHQCTTRGVPLIGQHLCHFFRDLMQPVGDKMIGVAGRWLWGWVGVAGFWCCLTNTGGAVAASLFSRLTTETNQMMTTGLETNKAQIASLMFRLAASFARCNRIMQSKHTDWVTVHLYRLRLAVYLFCWAHYRLVSDLCSGMEGNHMCN